ncbi:MAG: hypothetical protein PHQ43_04765 [Dehalococcoidales bacterium]|nr:hypothetical protein [Dehalococcoidales bacterium]
MNTDSLRKRLPPYVSYRTFRNFLDSLQQGIPARIDRSYWGDRWSGSSGSQLVVALRFLGLVDGNSVSTNRLKQLVLARDIQRTEVLRQMATEAFAFIFNSSLDLQTATYSQIEELLHDTYQITPDVSRKCIKFFIGLAIDAEIPLSPFIVKKSRVRTTNMGIRRTSSKGVVRTKTDSLVPKNDPKIPTQESLDKILLSKFPTFDPNWTDEVKTKWFEAFDTLLRRVSGSGDGDVNGP